MSYDRRARPTIRCLVEDLGLELPGLAADLGEIDHPWLGSIWRAEQPTERLAELRANAGKARDRAEQWVEDIGAHRADFLARVPLRLTGPAFPLAT